MAEDDDNIGKLFGNYRIIKKIGTGGNGHVYLARHILIGRPFAIKLLYSRLPTQKEYDQFLQEAQFLVDLKHPNILSFYEFGIHERFPYLVMEYAPNGSLRDLIESQSPYPLPVEKAITILVQIGQALQVAHQQNIVHRDLKPENILFNAKGEVLLADFGIAIVLKKTKQVDFEGTPLYMAPEQFVNEFSQKSDQYALGCIAYELVAGQTPFTGNILGLAYQHVNRPPTPPTQLNPNLPASIEQAILKAMEKERADRYSDVLTFIMALQMSFKQWSSQAHVLHDIGLYEAVINLDPRDVIPYYNKAAVLKNLKRYEEALATYDQIIALGLDDVSAYICKGVILRDLERHDEALVVYNQIISLAPDFELAYENKAQALKHLKHYNEALMVYEQLISLDPNNADAYHGKGTVLEQLGNLAEARRLYAKAMSLGYES